MKLAVVCANDRVGTLIVKEALKRGLDVTAVVRKENRTAAENVVQKDLFDLTATDLEGFDVVVDAFGAWKEDLPNHSRSPKHLCNILSGRNIRLVVVGGANSLYVNPEHTIQVCYGSDFPAEYLPLAKAQGKALAELRGRKDVQWTFISPTADFQAEGTKTGNYILAGEELALNSKGESVISYADYAAAILVGAGVGLDYSGERFMRYVSDFAEQYGIRDMYSGGSYPFDSAEEYWAWLSRHIWYNRYDPGSCEVYRNLYELVRDQDYFVLTTNVDHQFQLAGFDKKECFTRRGITGFSVQQTLMSGNIRQQRNSPKNA